MKKKVRYKYIITADASKMGIAYPDFPFKKKTVYSKKATEWYAVRGYTIRKVKM